MHRSVGPAAEKQALRKHRTMALSSYTTLGTYLLLFLLVALVNETIEPAFPILAHIDGILHRTGVVSFVQSNLLPGWKRQIAQLEENGLERLTAPHNLSHVLIFLSVGAGQLVWLLSPKRRDAAKVETLKHVEENNRSPLMTLVVSILMFIVLAVVVYFNINTHMFFLPPHLGRMLPNYFGIAFLHLVTAVIGNGIFDILFICIPLFVKRYFEADDE